ncbi:extracellular solute-binding protein [Actinoplanes sp. NPDC049599]|uniref:extracellular solute-binding protein n=1 Tax=Actinoplanes sp. NPDC049599 TaxID=3363903 RepID=UPI00378BB372
MTLSRRAFLSGTAAAATLGLAGCSGLTPGRDTGGSLDYWNLFGGGDGVRMNQMLDGFRTANPGIDLSAVTLAWGNPYYTKLALATVGDKPPDVAISHLTRMKTLVGSDLLEELHPEDLARHGITADKFTERAWQAGLVEGRAYAIPIDTHPFVMFYNTDICAKAGLLDPSGTLRPLDSPEKFTDAMRRAKEASGGYGGVVSIDNDTSTSWRIFQSLYSQLGGETLADEGRRVVIDDAKAAQVLTFLQSLTRSGVFPAAIDYQGAIATFATGQAGFYFQGEWEISTFQTAKMPFSMTLFPNLYGGARYAVQADSHTLVIPRRPETDRARLDRSLLLVRSMLDQSRTWAEGGHVPTWKPFRDSPEYAAMTPQSNYAAAADGAVYDPDGWYSGSGSNFEIVTGSAIADVLGGRRSPAAAIAQMRDKLQTLSTTASPI